MLQRLAATALLALALALVACGDDDGDSENAVPDEGVTQPDDVDEFCAALDDLQSGAVQEPDALAFRVGEHLELVEIKSYPIIDGQADPGKLSSTAGQAAVYHTALRATLDRLGFDPELLVWSVILVAPRNFGRTPVAHRVPLKKKSMSLARVLRGYLWRF